jgi:arginyl-tRNA synthetase
MASTRRAVGPAHDAVGALVAGALAPLPEPIVLPVSQGPAAPNRPGPFKVDLRPVGDEQARDRSWLRQTAQAIAATPGVVGAVAVPPSIYVRPDPRWLHDHVVPRVLEQRDRYGLAPPSTGKHVAMKFSNPNANKALHIGHLRTNFLGMSISLLLEAQGWTVERLSVLSDWGIHICQAAVAYVRWGGGATPSSVGAKGDHFVAEFYVRFHQADERAQLDAEAVDLLRRAHAGDPSACAIVQQITEWCDAGITATYERIGTRLAGAPRESRSLTTAFEVLRDAEQRGDVRRRDDGSVYLPVPGSDEHEGELTLVRADGTPVVYTQWLGVDVDRHSGRDLDGDVVLFGDQWEAGASVYAHLLATLGFRWPQENITHGMVVTPEGAMSSRQGSGVRADDALNHFFHCFVDLLRAEGRPVDAALAEACELLGTAFLKYALLRKPRRRPAEFDADELWERQRRGFCQLVKTVVDVARPTGAVDVTHDRDAGGALSDVLLSLNAFPEVVARAADDHDPAPLVRFVDDLVAQVARCDRAGGLDDAAREAARVVFAQTLRLLNIDITGAVEVLGADGGTMHVPAESEAGSAARRLVGLRPRRREVAIRSRGDEDGDTDAASVLAAVSMEADRLVQVASDPPRLAIPSQTINAFGERCFEIDTVLEREVVAILARHGGVRRVLSEESGVIPLADTGCTVVLDPIDGTKNYKMGLSYYAMSLAVLSDTGAVTGGLVLNLATGTQYTAIRGRGAFRNGRVITASAPESPRKSDVIYVGLSRTAPELAALSRLAAEVSSMRAMGCSALDLCCLATGNIGIFVDMSNTAKTVDVLAAALIAEEAGAVVTSLSGEPVLDGVQQADETVARVYEWRFRTVAAATEELHGYALDLCGPVAKAGGPG